MTDTQDRTATSGGVAAIARTSVQGRRAWLLQTAGTSTLLSVGDDGALLVEHWGGPLGSADTPQPYLPARPWNRPSQAHFLDGVPVAYSVYGEATFKEPCLCVVFADGTRTLSLELDSDAITEEGDGESLSLVFEDPVYKLQVEHVFKVFHDLDVVVRTVTLRNAGQAPVDVERALTAAWGLPPGDYEAWLMQGRGWGDEFHAVKHAVRRGRVVSGSRNGYTSREAHPWFAIAPAGETRQAHGQAWFGALAWSGNWTIVVESERNDSAHVVAGLNPFDFSWRLEPGESFETPALVSGYTEEGLGGASRILQRYTSRQVLPETHRRRLRPVHYNSWFSTMFDVRVEHQLRLAKRAAELGADLFVIDDGWFGERNSPRAGLGDWVVNREKFPEGLDQLGDAVRDLGMGFGIWVEPEMVNPDSDLYRVHPEWTYHFPDRPATLARDQLVLNFARQDVREAIHAQLRRLIRDHRIDFLKWDHNRPYTEVGWPDAPTGRQREVWVRHVRGVYEVMAALREEFPNLWMETCAGGGGRVDLGMLRVTDQSWVSDDTDPADRLKLQYHYSHVYPASTMVAWVTDTPNHETRRVPPMRFQFHVAMQGVLGISSEVLQWSDAQCAEARELIAAYKSVQDVIQWGEQYWLIPPDESGRCAVQYVSADGDRAVVFLYQVRGVISEGYRRVRLTGLDADAVYRRSSDGVEVRGAALLSSGLPMFPPPEPITDWRSDMQVWERLRA